MCNQLYHLRFLYKFLRFRKTDQKKILHTNFVFHIIKVIKNFKGIQNNNKVK